MATLKDYFETDIDMMLNTDEFAEDHSVNGVTMPIIIDNDQLKKLQALPNQVDGVYVGEILFMVKKSLFGAKPAYQSIISLDGKKYRVTESSEDAGLLAIIMSANEVR